MGVASGSVRADAEVGGALVAPCTSRWGRPACGDPVVARRIGLGELLALGVH